MRANLLRLMALAALSIVVLGCSVQLRTASAPGVACDLALLAGSLERHAQTGLGIGVSDVLVTPVEWPFGYSARMELQTTVLVDETGRVVAREHDRVEVGGGLGNGEVWFACGDVKVVSNEGG